MTRHWLNRKRRLLQRPGHDTLTASSIVKRTQAEGCSLSDRHARRGSSLCNVCDPGPISSLRQSACQASSSPGLEEASGMDAEAAAVATSGSPFQSPDEQLSAVKNDRVSNWHSRSLLIPYSPHQLVQGVRSLHSDHTVRRLTGDAHEREELPDARNSRNTHRAQDRTCI